MNDSEVRQQINKGIYALLSLTIAGVMSFAVYVVKDLSADIQTCKGMLISLHKEVADIRAVQAMKTEQLTELKRQVIEIHHEMEKK